MPFDAGKRASEDEATRTAVFLGVDMASKSGLSAKSCVWKSQAEYKPNRAQRAQQWVRHDCATIYQSLVHGIAAAVIFVSIPSTSFSIDTKVFVRYYKDTISTVIIFQMDAHEDLENAIFFVPRLSIILRRAMRTKCYLLHALAAQRY